MDLLDFLLKIYNFFFIFLFFFLYFDVVFLDAVVFQFNLLICRVVVAEMVENDLIGLNVVMNLFELFSYFVYIVLIDLDFVFDGLWGFSIWGHLWCFHQTMTLVDGTLFRDKWCWKFSMFFWDGTELRLLFFVFSQIKEEILGMG